MATTLLLFAYALPIVAGLLLIVPGTSPLFAGMSERFPSFATRRGRLLSGLNLTILGGLAVSVQTQWIHAKVSEGSNFCASDTIFSCDDVIGNMDYNTVPFFDVPWGMVGFVTFSALLFMSYSISKEPSATWVKTFLDLGTLVTFAGLGVIGLLVSYEIEMEKICQFCTTAHIANIVALAAFWQLRSMHGEKAWQE
jgi:uncharacterized membrane protein